MSEPANAFIPKNANPVMVVLAGLVQSSLLGTAITTVITAFFLWLVLKFLDSRSFVRVLGTVILAKAVSAIILPFSISLFLPRIEDLWLIIMEIVVSFLVYKTGLRLSLGRTIILIIVTPILTVILAALLALLGIAALVGFAALA